NQLQSLKPREKPRLGQLLNLLRQNPHQNQKQLNPKQLNPQLNQLPGTKQDAIQLEQMQGEERQLRVKIHLLKIRQMFPKISTRNCKFSAVGLFA
ncbi:hypothetical protein B7486_40375, partial [cyanobacterium TDX16]